MQVLSHVTKNYQQALPAEVKKKKNQKQYDILLNPLLGRNRQTIAWHFSFLPVHFYMAILGGKELPTDQREIRFQPAHTLIQEGWASQDILTEFIWGAKYSWDKQFSAFVLHCCCLRSVLGNCHQQQDKTFLSFPKLQGRQHELQYNTSGQI